MALTCCIGRFNWGKKKQHMTIKGDIPHYCFILSNIQPLGTDLMNVVCSRIVNILYLDIQKDKEEMKSSEFKQVIGGTAT